MPGVEPLDGIDDEQARRIRDAVRKIVAESDAETAAAWRFARAASPALENESADEKCT